MRKPQRNKIEAKITEPDTGGTDEPDQYTEKAPDWTDNSAPARVFFINLGFFRYGTKDKSHGAAVLLSFALLIVILSVIGVGVMVGSSEWLDRVFTWLGSAFLFLAGVAVGRSPGKENGPNDD